VGLEVDHHETLIINMNPSLEILGIAPPLDGPGAPGVPQSTAFQWVKSRLDAPPKRSRSSADCMNRKISRFSMDSFSLVDLWRNNSYKLWKIKYPTGVDDDR
jgi:hypothetical protein